MSNTLAQIIDVMFFTVVVGAPFCVGPPMVIRAILASSYSRYLAIAAVIVSGLAAFKDIALPFGDLLGSIDGHRPAVSIAIILFWIASSLPKSNGRRWIDLLPVVLLLILFFVFADVSQSMKTLD